MPRLLPPPEPLRRRSRSVRIVDAAGTASIPTTPTTLFCSPADASVHNCHPGPPKKPADVERGQRDTQVACLPVVCARSMTDDRAVPICSEQKEAHVYTRAMLTAVALAVVAATSCARDPNARDPNPREPFTVTIAPDSIIGCRAPTTGCERCCLPSRSGHVILAALAGEGDVYNLTDHRDGACPSDIPSCARCSNDEERLLRQLAAAPVCECPSGDVGIDPCYSPTGCACFCTRLEIALAACTDASS